MNIPTVTTTYGAQEAYGPKIRKGVRRQNGQDKPSAATVRVEISERSASFQNVKKAVDRLPEIRIHIVEEIKRKIDMNDYPIENTINDVVKNLLEKEVVYP